MTSFKELSNSVVIGNDALSVQICMELLSKGVSNKDIMSKGLIDGMDKVGFLFKTKKAFVPEVIMSVRAMNAGIQTLKLDLCDDDMSGVYFNDYTMIVGTVQGDIHNIGKNIVSILLKNIGFNVIDLGTNVSKEEFIAQTRSSDTSILALSAMLTTSMPNMKEVVRALQAEDFGRTIHIMIGGAPITQRFADELGVYYTETAVHSQEMAIGFIKKLKL